MSATIDLVVLTVYDPSIVGTRTLYYGNQGWTTATTDTPASTYFDGRLTSAPTLTRNVYDTGTTGGASRPGYGDLVLANDDGALDALRSYGFDGRTVTWYRGLASAAFPGGFDVQTFTMQQPSFGLKEIRIALRDQQASLNTPLQTTLYAGSNALPSGLEGTANDLKGKPKPLTYGKVLNVPAVCVNTSKLIYQVHDGAIASLDAVYDRGIALGSTLFVAAGGGSSSNIATSTTGTAWGLQASGVLPSGGGTCSCIGASGTLVIGDTAGVQYSTDGATWTFQTISASFLIQGIAYNGSNLYVAVGHNSGTGEIWTSPDLVTWTKRTPTGFGANIIRCVAWDSINTQWVAGGDLGLLSTGNSTGTTWTARTTGYGGTIYTVVVSGTKIVISGTSAVYTSPTGVTWTSRTSPFTGGSTIYAGTYGNSTVVLAGDSGQLATSIDDGVTWTLRASRYSTADAIRALLWTGSLFVSGGDNGSLASSPDAVNWTLQSAGYPAGSYQIRCIAYASGLSAGTYANTTDLQDDSKAPAAGSVKVYLGGGYFRLGSSPDGQITADVTEGSTSADRTTAQVFKRVMTKAGVSVSATDVTALDIAQPAVVGVFIAEPRTTADVLTQIAGGAGCWWGVDRTNVFRLQQFTAPSGSVSATITSNDLLSFERLTTNDLGNGLPVYSVIVRWGQVYTVQTTDLAAGVTQARREIVGKQWREATSTDTSVQTTHLLAPQVTIESCFTTATDAATEAARVQTLRGTLRDLYRVTVPMTATYLALDLFSVVTLTHARYGLSGGRNFRVLGIAPSPLRDVMDLVLWA